MLEGLRPDVLQWRLRELRSRLRDGIARRVAYTLPRRVVYWAAIRAGVHAANLNPTEEVPGLKLETVLGAWEQAA